MTDALDAGEDHAAPARRRPPVWSVVATTVLIVALAAVLLMTTTSYQLERVPGDGSVEAGFTRDMMAHHAQAVEMAEILRGATDDPEMQLLASDIALTQQTQIGQMLAWLDVWGLRANAGPENRPMAWMGMAVDSMADMPGMADRDDLTALAALDGMEAERRFLQLMITHHAAGVDMAQAALDRTDVDVVRQLANQIAATQRSEIDTMEGLLGVRGGDATASDGGATGMADDEEAMDHGS